MGSALLESRSLHRARQAHVGVRDQSRPVLRVSAAGSETRGPFELGGSRALTLDDLIARTWNELTSQATARCPACSGQMILGPAGGDRDGHCLDCGAQLS
jgi:hypothetical protein